MDKLRSYILWHALLEVKGLQKNCPKTITFAFWTSLWGSAQVRSGRQGTSLAINNHWVWPYFLIVSVGNVGGQFWLPPFMWLVTRSVIKNKIIKSNVFALICSQSDVSKSYITTGDYKLLKDAFGKLLKQVIVNCNETAQQSPSTWNLPGISCRC